jgi:predicted dehydrogenase
MTHDVRHNLVVIGVGSIGERHLRCFQQSGRCQLSFVEINESLRQTISNRYEAPSFADLDAALAEGPTTAVIATPAHLHIPLAVKLAEAGLHLLIEKPLSTDLSGVDELRQIVASRGVTAAVAYVMRCQPALAAMRQAVASGRFGRPLEVVAVAGQNFPTYRPAYREIYYAKHATGGGAIQDAITHLLNAGEWLVGPITRVVADASHQALPGVSVEDTVHVLARHGDVLANYSLNQYQAPNEVTLTVVCEQGTVRFEAHHHRWRWMTTPDTPWEDAVQEPLSRDAPFLIQASKFLDAIEGRRPPLCSLDEGIQSLRVNLAALCSVESGGWETINDELL